VREQRADDGADLPGARVADKRAAGTGNVRPVHARRFVGLGLVPAQQHDRVARFGVRQRNARVRGSRDHHGHPGHHFERNALLVEEDGFLAAAVEDERVAPFQPHHNLAFARLVGEQVADGVLIERLGRGGADVDALGIRTGAPHRRGGHAVIVEDDIGIGHAIPAAHRQQRRIARSRADDVNEWSFVHRLIFMSKAVASGFPPTPSLPPSLKLRRAAVALAEAGRRTRRSFSGGRAVGRMREACDSALPSHLVQNLDGAFP
jgi:hypothetical protein